MGQLQAEIDPQWSEGSYSFRADISWLVLVGFYCACATSYITFKLVCVQSPMIFLDCHVGCGTMFIYHNAIIMKQGPCSIFCEGAFMIHHDSALFQKARTTGLRTESVSCINVPCRRPGVPLESPHS